MGYLKTSSNSKSTESTPTACRQRSKSLLIWASLSRIRSAQSRAQRFPTDPRTACRRHCHQLSKQDVMIAYVHGDVVNLPLSLCIEVIRFRLFGAPAATRTEVDYAITEHAKCVCLIEFVSSDR